MRYFCKLKAIIYILLLSALWGNALYANPGELSKNCNSVSADEKVTGNKDVSAKSLAYKQMHLGLFIHYTYAGKPYQWGSTLWADIMLCPSNVDININIAIPITGND